jgi:hypothetical protein
VSSLATLLGGVAAQRVVVGGDRGQAVGAGLLQAVQPLQGFADFFVLEAGGGKLQGELLGFGIGVGVEKIFEEIDKYVEHGGVVSSVHGPMRWNRPPGRLAILPSSSSCNRMAYSLSAVKPERAASVSTSQES